MTFHKKLQELEYLARKYDETNIPLYVSYPTSAFWKSKVDKNDFITKGRTVDRPFMYFHFPYCRKACYYCCCYKKVSTDMAELELYLDYIIKEYNQKLDILGIDKLEKITQIHWGGGTPTYMTMKQIERAFKSFEERACIEKSDKSSISLEAYPDDEVITYEKLKLLKDLGFNEISFGIQDFDDRIQKIINRNCNPIVVSKLIEQAKSLGLRVHVDLCYGLPFQGQNEFEKTAREVIGFQPDRIAVFPYAHYPYEYPMQRLIPTSSVPNSFIKVLLAEIANDLFISSGYVRIGSDHFIKKDNIMYQNYMDKMVERDFMGYSVDERKQFFGFGNSAISFLGDTLFHNLIPMDEYYKSISSGDLGIHESMSHTLSADDAIRKRVMLKHILSYMEIEYKDFEDEFNISFDAYFNSELLKLENFQKDGLIEKEGSKIRFTKYGVYFSRHIAHIFDQYYNKINKGAAAA